MRLPFTSWLEMTGLVLIALIPFAALGIGLGHCSTTTRPARRLGGGVSLFAFLGGSWFPITGGGLFIAFCKLLPSYWLVQAGHVGLGGDEPVGRRGVGRDRGVDGRRRRRWRCGPTGGTPAGLMTRMVLASMMP